MLDIGIEHFYIDLNGKLRIIWPSIIVETNEYGFEHVDVEKWPWTSSGPIYEQNGIQQIVQEIGDSGNEVNIAKLIKSREVLIPPSLDPIPLNGTLTEPSLTDACTDETYTEDYKTFRRRYQLA